MTVRVTHTLDDLHRDLRQMPAREIRERTRVLRANANLGNKIAKGNAKKSSGSHGRHYPDAFSVEAVDSTTWAYGPDASKKQGNMSFEYGSRNQPPHLDLNKSADIIGPKLGEDVRKMIDGLFWP